jgi:hypothetical protein
MSFLAAGVNQLLALIFSLINANKEHQLGLNADFANRNSLNNGCFAFLVK